MTTTRKADLEGLADSYFVSEELLKELVQEVRRGVAKWGDYKSLGQAREVILDEYIELYWEIRKKDSEKDWSNLRAEALQVAATAIRLCEEIDQGRLQ